ncbi:Rrf2 family transcriptional regulator [Rhodopirellula halodulae]|uniref:Rrf2 family transcriptional regulator n=1 Tax=Rhodopirellula halodulae TaxID=2894198 RepID=UPI001E497A1B|nr:Rrf2 family transcriptional regulator [Rhodopirellula sp. JC737]MCC9654553.1 Rrf2 family transcriptional regulator [Rhodopirellula sp. JC737]
MKPSRRLMAGLHKQGYVESEKGYGGGWTLACDLHVVTLLGIYEAVGSPSLLAIGHRTEAPGCLVEQSVNAVLGETFDEAEQLLLQRLGEVTLASLSADCHERLQARGISLKAKRNSHGV